MSTEKLTEREANSYSPLTLAFLGDSVYDTLVREHLLRQANMPVAKLHSAKIKLVCAEFQSKAYDLVTEVLTEHELAVLKRGRNATGNTVPKHADAAEYRRATALECLFGYLYLTGGNERIRELFELIINSNLNEQIGV
ncbi:Mini-ribonuclease 3 [Ruminococcus flavefaciens]|uniref:Mini-ribonuclease 3 n=1 Tax=Ruminococcus flavefaciens TaxID=1265 RepID=UPI001568AAE9|nr:ribonuclease III domain-containing protein [Ruminococcus flavefaciens]MBQ6213201.1 ribonuclease III [Ruminococcus sp.]